MSPLISAIVCTYNRKELLVDALQALVEQDLPPTDYEIIVVDNNSTDGTGDVIAEHFGGVSNVRVIREEKQGLAQARNAGARVARSPIAAYTDDDALVPRSWLRRMIELFHTLDPVPGVIGGDIEPVFDGERPAWLTDELLRPLSAALRWSNTPHYLDPQGTEWLCEVNSAYRIEPLMKLGGFPENLGRVGHNLLSGENCVNVVLQHTGHPLYYDPTNIVRHRVPKGRMTRAWFRRRMFWQGVSQVIMRGYLKEHGVKAPVFRPLKVPCAPSDWVDLFDEQVDDEKFPAALDSILNVGYLLATQNLLSGR